MSSALGILILTSGLILRTSHRAVDSKLCLNCDMLVSLTRCMTDIFGWIGVSGPTVLSSATRLSMATGFSGAADLWIATRLWIAMRLSRLIERRLGFVSLELDGL